MNKTTRLYMQYKDLVDDLRFLYKSGLQKFLESKRYRKIRKKYLETLQDLPDSKGDKKIDKVLGIKK